MSRVSESHAVEDLPCHLAKVFDVETRQVVVLPPPSGLDFAAEINGVRLIVEVKSRGDTASTLAGLRRLEQAPPDGHPLLVVPYMGATGASLCHERRVSWTDLSGNAHIVVPGVRIILRGFKNKFRTTGRPSNPFAPKSARVARELLHAPSGLPQSELARRTGLGTGFVSRIVRRLSEDGLLQKDPDGVIVVPQPSALLEAWAERYSFGRQRMLKGHISARSSPELMHVLHEALERAEISHAFTGLASAWARQEFARFRLVTLYSLPLPPEEILDPLRFRVGDRGANVYLVEPADPAVFQHLEHPKGLPCASALQTYLDLLELPERAAEAAAELRSQYLVWDAP